MTRGAGPHEWFDAPLPANVLLEEGSWLYSSFAFIHYASRRQVGVKIGRHSGVYDGTMFDLGPNGCVEIGEYCTIVAPIISTDGLVTIGDHTMIAHEVVLADSSSAVPPRRGSLLPAERAPTAGDIHIGRGVWVGMRSILLPGARVGEGAIVGAATVLCSEVPPYAVVAGNPARVVGWSEPPDWE